eukprot:3007359-Rhodomonas_salina.1
MAGSVLTHPIPLSIILRRCTYRPTRAGTDAAVRGCHGPLLQRSLILRALLKSSRAIFDTVETQKGFGPISVDFAKVQNGVSMKYDAWHKEMMSAFGLMLQDKIRVLFAELRSLWKERREERG